MTKQESIAQLKWACRRGMLELDILLNKFLDQAYRHLSKEDQNLFGKLLQCQDQELFMWLTGKEPVPDKDLRLLVEKIRHHAKTQH